MSEAAAKGSREAAANNIRETIKWIIAAFAAPLAIMVGTSPLTNVGALHGQYLIVAAVGGGAGALMIIWAIKLATDILVMKTFFLGEIKGDLEHYVDEHAKDLLPVGVNTYAAFVKLREDLFTDLAAATTPQAQQTLKEDIEALRPITARVLSLCNYERTRRHFEAIRLRLLAAAVIGVIAFGTFGWAIGAPSKPDAKPPVSVYCASPAR